MDCLLTAWCESGHLSCATGLSSFLVQSFLSAWPWCGKTKGVVQPFNAWMLGVNQGGRQRGLWFLQFALYHKVQKPPRAAPHPSIGWSPLGYVPWVGLHVLKTNKSELFSLIRNCRSFGRFYSIFSLWAERDYLKLAKLTKGVDS